MARSRRFAIRLTLFLLSAFVAVSGLAEDAESEPFDRLWSHASFEFAEDHAFLDEISLIGLIHYQVAHEAAATGAESESEFRRFRLGAELRALDQLFLHANFNFDPEEGPFYDSISQAYLSYSPFGNDKKARRHFSIDLGKLKPRFTREYSTSAKRIKTFERSLLVNQLSPAKATGLALSGTAAPWQYTLGVYSGDDEDEFSNFENGAIVLAKLGYDFGEAWNVAFDYLGASSDQEVTADISHAFSLSSSWNEDYASGPLAFTTDLIASAGRGETADAYGLVLMPSYQLTEKLEVIARYQFSASPDPDGLRLQRRYERSVGGSLNDTFGELYHAAYLGLNYYVYGDRLKFMAAVEYANMDGGRDGGDYDGWTWFLGARVYF